MHIKDFIQAVDYRITEVDDNDWNCYGLTSRTMTSWNGKYDVAGYSISAVFDTVDQSVYEMTAYDYERNHAYRWIGDDYRGAFASECVDREINNIAWDTVAHTDLDLEEDILEKTRAIVSGIEYDTRIMVSVEFSDKELLTYMKLAHEQDITFNQLIENALRAAIVLNNSNECA